MNEGNTQGKIDNNGKKALKAILDEMISPRIRAIIVELEKEPILQNIGEYLIEVPMREKVDKVKLITDVCKQTKLDFFTVKGAIRKMEENGYLYAETGSSSNYFLSPLFAEALELKRRIDKELGSLLEEIKNDPDLGKIENIEAKIKAVIYSTLLSL